MTTYTEKLNQIIENMIIKTPKKVFISGTSEKTKNPTGIEYKSLVYSKGAITKGLPTLYALKINKNPPTTHTPTINIRIYWI